MGGQGAQLVSSSRRRAEGPNGAPGGGGSGEASEQAKGALSPGGLCARQTQAVGLSPHHLERCGQPQMRPQPIHHQTGEPEETLKGKPPA